MRLEATMQMGMTDPPAYASAMVPGSINCALSAEDKEIYTEYTDKMTGAKYERKKRNI